VSQLSASHRLADARAVCSPPLRAASVRARGLTGLTWLSICEAAVLPGADTARGKVHPSDVASLQEGRERAVGPGRVVALLDLRAGDPPKQARSAYSTPVLRLITIPISHYCEKARWALERVRIPYREERHVQGIHRIAARRAGGGSTVPVLVTPEGAIGESREILAWTDERTPSEQRLFPGEPGARSEVEGLCRRFDEQLGPRGRRLMYVHMLAAREVMLSFNNTGVPAWEDRATRLGWPALVRFAVRALGIRPGIEAEDEAAVWREFDFVAERLADGRAHLCGERFGAADLTFAALSASVIVPPVYGVPLPQPDVLPPQTAALVGRAREHPAGRYALAMFAEYRREPAL
jgi:glutathione S-transferase